MSEQKPPARVKLTRIHTGPEGGVWYAIGTERQWFEFRVTPTGLIRVSEPVTGSHPVFMVQGVCDARD